MITSFLHSYSFTVSGKKQIYSLKNDTNNKKNEDIDTPIFDLSTITDATNNFSIDNKLGQGGFGLVFTSYVGNTVGAPFSDDQLTEIKRGWCQYVSSLITEN